MAKKKKSVDFQKVKFKVGRKLNKNTNITDTSFKAKKIFIPAREKHHENNVPTTHRNLNIKELLARLRHHNATTRYDALAGLKELLSQHPEMIISSLSILIEKITEMIIDNEYTIRTVALKTLETIFKYVSADQIAPFFSILKSYLSCATTHIQANVHDDSLRFLDLLLSFFPKLTTTTCSHILETLIQYTVDKSAKALTRKKLDLLTRLESFLQATVKSQKEHCNENNELLKFRQINSESLYIPIYRNGKCTPHVVNKFSLHQNLTIASDNESIIGNSVIASNFLTAVSPLLLEVLTECKLSSLVNIPKVKQKFPSVTLDIVQCVMNTIILLYECIETCDSANGNKQLVNKFYTIFQSTAFLKFISLFPFELNQVANATKQFSCTVLNLSICDVFTIVYPEITIERYSSYEKIIKFISTVLKSEEISGLEFTTKTIKVIDRINERISNLEITEKLLSLLYNVYNNWQIGRKDRNAIMKYFMTFTLNSANDISENSPTLQAWLKSLPNELVNANHECPSHIFNLVSNATVLSLRNFPTYQQGLQESWNAIIDLFPVICEKYPQENDLHFLIVELISTIPMFSRETFLALLDVILKDIVPVKPVLHLIEILEVRYQKNDDDFNNGDFVSFLLSLTLGVLKKDVRTLHERYSNDEKWIELRKLLPITMRFFIVPTDNAISNRHMTIAEKVSDIIVAYHVQELADHMQKYLVTIFSQYACLPTYTVASILILQSKLFHQFSMNDDFQLILADLSLSLLLYSVIVINTIPNCEKEVEYLLRTICQFLHTTKLSVKLCNIIWDRIKVSNVSQAAVIGSSFLLLIKSLVFRLEAITIIENILLELQLKFSQITEKKWFKELNYFISLAKGFPAM